MNSRHTRTRRGSIRALVAAVLLAGVFTMHGLTGNHDAAMAMGSSAVVSAHDLAPSASEISSREPATAEPSSQGHVHAMGDACLAMLAALLLALIVALARRSRTAAHPVQLTGMVVIVPVDGPSPPWRRPTLAKLCVLRT
jgi:hypothetical protein